MCRLLGIISIDAVPFDRCLLSAPRSLASLSNAQPDGWGAAVFDRAARDWRVEKRALRAAADETFASLAPRLRGAVLVAHIRARTVGAVSLANTHPFRRGKWVFAHNGTIEDLDYLRRGVSTERLRQCEGDTDSELLFAHLLTRLDQAGIADDGATSDVDAVVSDAVSGLVEHRVGTATFLFSDGAVLYAHRFGRALYIVERRGGSSVLAIASEPLTDEAWLPLDDCALLRCERSHPLDFVFLRGSDPRRTAEVSDVELAFTD